jgi:hypothetical protein
VVQRLREVVLGGPPSVPAAYQAATAAIGVATTALYHTLERGETGGAAAGVRDAARWAEPVRLALGASRPRWFPGDGSKGLDGTQ